VLSRTTLYPAVKIALAGAGIVLAAAWLGGARDHTNDERGQGDRRPLDGNRSLAAQGERREQQVARGQSGEDLAHSQEGNGINGAGCHGQYRHRHGYGHLVLSRRVGGRILGHAVSLGLGRETGYKASPG